MFIENVGNLVCPALFDLGECAKVVVFSTPEGEDKPLKYARMFRAASVVILNKIDLVQQLEFATDRAKENVHRVNPNTPILELSARTGEGLQLWYDWRRSERAAARALSWQTFSREG